MTGMQGRPTGPLDCAETRLSLGVLVLGVIDPQERLAVEEHLAGCELCSEALAELAALPGLLHRLDPVTAAEGLPEPSPEFTRRVVAAAAGDVAARRARRRVVAGAVAAVAATLLGVVLLAPRVLGGSDPAGGSRTTVVAGTDAATSVHAQITLSARPAGTQLVLALAGVAPGEHCQLVARDAAGNQEVAASWVASYEGRATVTGTTSLPAASITSLQVVRADGGSLVTLAVPHPAGD